MPPTAKVYLVKPTQQIPTRGWRPPLQRR
ncbi:hypothetical protein YPPY32_3869, partial [Yersinia pestis PY-32]